MRVLGIIVGIIAGVGVIFYIFFGLGDMRIGKIALTRSDYFSAVDRFQRILAKDPQDAQARLYLGITYGKMGDYEQAFKEFDWLKTVRPDFSISAQQYNEIGMFYYLKERRQEAIYEFKKAVELDPRFVDAYFNLGTAYSSLDNFQGAVAAYAAAVKIDPKHAYSHWNLAVVLEKLGNTQEAINHWEQYIKLTPGVFSNPEVAKHIKELKEQLK